MAGPPAAKPARPAARTIIPICFMCVLLFFYSSFNRDVSGFVFEAILNAAFSRLLIQRVLIVERVVDRTP